MHTQEEIQKAIKFFTTGDPVKDEFSPSDYIMVNEVRDTALKLYKKLLDEPRTEAVRKGFDVLEKNYDEVDSSRMGIQGLDRAFQAMINQACLEIKESEDDCR